MSEHWLSQPNSSNSKASDRVQSKRPIETPGFLISLILVVGKLSDAPLVHLSCPSRAPLVPLSCPSRAPLVHLSCPSRAPLVHLWRQCPRVPTVSQPCQNEKYRVPFSAHKCTSRAPLVPLSCTSRAPLVPLYLCPNRVLSFGVLRLPVYY